MKYNSTYIASLILVIGGATLAMPQDSDEPRYNFDAVRQTLAIVETDTGVGSGFVVTIDGNKYLLTNCHVVKDAKKLAFRLIDGETLVPRSIEIADSHDLVRFRLNNDSDMNALMLSSSSPSINQSVVVLGNSDGRGVVTQIEGKILGLGPDVIEVSAGFVSGNSGSPIISHKGDVLGVATYVTRTAPNKDWIIKGTRFETTRRFGLRVTDNMKWNRISWRQLVEQTALIDEINDYANDLIIILACWRNYSFIDNPKETLREYAIIMNDQTATPLRKQINSFIREYVLYVRDGKQYSERSYKMKSLRASVTAQFRTVSDVARQRLKKTIWVSSDYVRQAKELDELLELLSEETEKVLDNPDFWSLDDYHHRIFPHWAIKKIMQ